MNSKKIYITVAVISIIALLVITIIFTPHSNIGAPTNTSSSNTSTPITSGNQKQDTAEGQMGQVVIENFSKSVANLSASEQTNIQGALYNVMILNNSQNDVLKTSDATIRDGSVEQTYDQEHYLYSTHFLIDIPSLKQTYQIYDKYSSVPSIQKEIKSGLSALCPEESQLKYGNFSCTDIYRQQEGD